MGTLKWHWCTNEGKKSDHDVGFQADEVGNILQRSGAIKTKACQTCKKSFKPKGSQTEIKQAMDVYTCDRCEFISGIPQDGLVHTIKFKDHVLRIKEDTKIVGYRNILLHTAIIEFKNEDCIILCEKCNDLKKH